MKSPSSMTIDSTAAEPTTTAASKKENENDVAIVVTRNSNSRKRSSAAISHRSSVGVVTPPRPSSSSASATTPTSHVVSAQVDGESQVATSPPQVVDLLNIGTDDFSIIRLSLFNEMIPGELQNFCLKIVGLCDKYTMNDGKMMFALKPGHILKSIEKNKFVFKALIDEYCPPLSALVTILESNGCLRNLYPLLLLGQLHMHADRKIQYEGKGKIYRWCLNITDKKMKLQQQGNRDNHVVFPCDHGWKFSMYE